MCASAGERMKKKSNVGMVCAMMAALCGGIASPRLRAQVTATLDIDVNKPGVAIPKMFYGLMTEEINHAYDGGLFAELIQNRTFQDPPPRRKKVSGDWPIHWWLVQDAGG